MTQPLRRAHFLLWCLVAVLGLVLLAVGVTARKDTTPRNPHLDWNRLR